MVLEEIAPEAKKWDMAAAVASHLARLIPEPQVGGSASPMRLDAPKALRRRKPFCFGRKQYIPRCHDRFQPCLLGKCHRSHGRRESFGTSGSETRIPFVSPMNLRRFVLVSPRTDSCYVFAARTCSGRKPIPTIRAVIRRSSGKSSSSRAGRGGDIWSVAPKMRSRKWSCIKICARCVR